MDQGRETIEEALRQVGEVVPCQVPLGVEGRGDEPRRDDKLVTDNFVLLCTAIIKA